MLGELVRASGLLTATAVVTGAFGYVFQVLMARLLADSYGTFGAFNAMSMLLMSPLGAVGVILVRRVAAAIAQEAFGEVHWLYRRSLTGVAGAGLVSGVLTAAFLPMISSYLRAPNSSSVWLLWALTIISVVGAINAAFLQGFKQFAWLGALGSGGVLLKIAASAFCITGLGWGLNGALAGMTASVLLVTLLSGALVWAEIQSGPDSPTAAPSHRSFSLQALVPVTVASFALSAMTQLDMVLVNRYFDSLSASHYAAAAILGKIVLYLPGGIVTALLPLVSQRHARSESGGQELKQALLMTGAVCGSAAISFAVAGRWLVQVLYGPDYSDAGHLLQMYGFAMLPITIMTVVENFMMAQGRTLFAWLFLIACPLEVWVIHVWHPSLPAVIGVLGLFNAVTMLIGCSLIMLKRDPG